MSAHHKQQSPLPDWQSDWLYRLIFQEAEDNWEMCERNKNSDYWQYVLIEEWSSADGAHCRGELLQLWLRDAQGLRQIPLESRKEHQRKIKSRIFPFILISFHIHPDRTRVVFCHREANTSGMGRRYMVIGDHDNATLEVVPSGGFWRS